MIRLGDLVATARQALDAAGIAEAGLDADGIRAAILRRWPMPSAGPRPAAAAG